MKKTTRFWAFVLTGCLLFSFAACRKEMPAEAPDSSTTASASASETVSAPICTVREATESSETQPDTTAAAETSAVQTTSAPQTVKKESFTAFSYGTAAHRPSAQTTAPHTTTVPKSETTTADRREPPTPQTTIPPTAAAAQIVTEPSTAVLTVRVVVDCRHACTYQQENPGKTIRLPDNTNGVILDEAVPYTAEDTALSVLQKALARRQLVPDETRGYVRGIGGLYEKDCGGTSGWMYSVNGETPAASAENYQVSAGDTVKFYYVTKFGDMA